MASQFIDRIIRTPAVFTAGDLVDGLAFMEPTARRAVLFGVDNALRPGEVTQMTHKKALWMTLSPLSAEIVKTAVRHIRIDNLFWTEEGGVLQLLTGIDRTVAECFGGMSLADLTACYQRMVWIDEQLEADYFLAIARQEGLF